MREQLFHLLWDNQPTKLFQLKKSKSIKAWFTDKSQDYQMLILPALCSLCAQEFCNYWRFSFSGFQSSGKKKRETYSCSPKNFSSWQIGFMENTFNFFFFFFAKRAKIDKHILQFTQNHNFLKIKWRIGKIQSSSAKSQ